MKMRYVYATYILFILGSYFYVKNVIASEELTIIDTDDPINKEVEEVKPIDTILTITAPNYTKTYQARVLTNDSVRDLLDHLREDQDFSYETTAYTYGTEISQVNGITPPEGFRWAIYNEGNDITYDIEKFGVDADTDLLETYEFKLIQRSELQ